MWQATGSAKRGVGLPAAVAAFAVAALVAACGGGGDGGGGGAGGGGGGGQSQAALRAEIDRLFPFTPNQPFDVTFACGRANSQLTYYFAFASNSQFAVYITLNNNQDVSFAGTYTYSGGQIRMLALNNPILPLDETTTRIEPHMGLIGIFETPNMVCGALGHGYNAAATDTFKSYDCPLINIGVASDEDNSIEFVHSAMPFNLAVRGSIFRQRDIHVRGQANPNVVRGYGIYRRVGDTFYADFANQFPDYNLLKGTFAAGDSQLSVEQLSPASGACRRR